MGRHRRSDTPNSDTDHRGEASAAAAPTLDGDPARPDPTEGHPVGIALYLDPDAAERARADQAYAFARGEDSSTPAEVGRSVDLSHRHGFAPDTGGRRGPAHRRRRPRPAAAPLRTGLLGATAAVAFGTIAVATGVVPGLDDYRIGSGDGGDEPAKAAAPTGGAAPHDGTTEAGETERGDTGTSRDRERTVLPSEDPSPAVPDAPIATPEAGETEAPAPSTTAPEAGGPRDVEDPRAPSAADDVNDPESLPREIEEAERPAAPATDPPEGVAEAEVVRLVNIERAQAGCRPLETDGALAGMAGDFSRAMAEQGFFDHTAPGGTTPWDRAEEAGIADLGGENIARGQADAPTVVEAWMSSPGHRANILNCDFRTLGVGVHFGSGGPWWTQDFGY
ncbi:CAP domain-containing protein [Streptomyces sp. ZYX-F-203]